MSLWTVVGRFNRRVWLRTRWGVLTGRSLLNLAQIVAWVAARVIDFMETGATASITAPRASSR